MIGFRTDLSWFSPIKTSSQVSFLISNFQSAFKGWTDKWTDRRVGRRTDTSLPSALYYLPTGWSINVGNACTLAKNLWSSWGGAKIMLGGNWSGLCLKENTTWHCSEPTCLRYELQKPLKSIGHLCQSMVMLVPLDLALATFKQHSTPRWDTPFKNLSGRQTESNV